MTGGAYPSGGTDRESGVDGKCTGDDPGFETLLFMLFTPFVVLVEIEFVMVVFFVVDSLSVVVFLDGDHSITDRY